MDIGDLSPKDFSEGSCGLDAVPNDPNTADPAAGPALSKAAAQMELLVVALARGATYAEAGAAAEISERTVRRRMSDPAFAAEVARRRAAYVSTVTGALVSSAQRAVEVIMVCLETDKPSDRLHAAQLLLTLMRRFHFDSDLDARLLALEAVANLAGTEPGDE